jgi:hypothetical protein
MASRITQVTVPDSATSPWPRWPDAAMVESRDSPFRLICRFSEDRHHFNFKSYQGIAGKDSDSWQAYRMVHSDCMSIGKRQQLAPT